MDRSDSEKSRTASRGRMAGGREGSRNRDARRADPSRSKPRPVRPEGETSLRIGKRSKQLFVVAVAVIVLGFIALALGSTTLAPILLVVGYLVLVPWAIIAREKPAKGGEAGAGRGPEAPGRVLEPGAEGDGPKSES